MTLSGGLGNQLFQVTAGTYLETVAQREIIFNIVNLTKKPKSEINNYTRSLEVSELIADNKLIRHRYPLNLDSINRFTHRLRKPESVIIENDAETNVLSRVSNSTIAIYGYFQNANLVETTWPKLRAKMEKSQKFNQLVSNKKIDRILIHLRFGDYSDDPKTRSIHGLTALSYYREALKIIRASSAKSLDLVVVTDDNQKAMDYLDSIDEDLEYSFFMNSDPIKDLFEMSRSSHIIMANSTFSWWGAWLAHKNHNSKIIYPRPWFANNADPNLPIYYDKWLTLKREFQS